MSETDTSDTKASTPEDGNERVPAMQRALDNPFLLLFLGVPMSQVPATPGPVDDEMSDEPIPMMQQLCDNPFLLLFLGVTMPTVLYIIWGIMELVQIPVAPP